MAAPKQLKDTLPQVELPKCAADNFSCILLGDILRDASNLKWDLLRDNFDKQTLPVLNIYLTDGALEKLYAKRQETLDKPGQILIGEDDDWVGASLVVNDGEPGHKLKGQLRLKGDWADHINHPTKISFRIKVQKEGYVFGMKRFSIQHPKTRKFQGEPLLMDEMRRWGVIAPRYQFVDVRINDYAIGVMALEEHFSKELLESQMRREGPIVILDEDLMWRQKDLNMRNNPAGDPKAPQLEDSNIFMHDLPTRQFRAPSHVPGSTATNNSIRAMSLYRDFVDGALHPENVFDLQKLAQWWVLINTWYSCHGEEAHNRRFYFNPTTNLMEPIAFDNYPRTAERNAQTPNCDPMVAPFLLGNPDFQRYVLAFSEELLQSYRDPQWQEKFQQSQMASLNVLALEDLTTDIIFTRDLLNNLSWFLDNLTPYSAPYVVSQRAKGFAYRYPDAPLYSHVRAFLFPEGDSMTLQLKNRTADPLHNIQVLLTDASGEHGVIRDVEDLPAFRQGLPVEDTRHISDIDLGRSFTEGTQVSVRFQHRGQTFTEPASTQFRDHETGFDSAFTEALSGRPDILVDSESKSIIFGAGEHTIEHSLELGKGWSVMFEAGSQLSLVNGATLKVRGPLYMLGSKDSPVKVHVTPSLDYLGIGAWGGILVSQSEVRSKVQHALLSGAGLKSIANRQDYYGITGCISFYESDVDVVDTTFENMHCEDALNIVRADFTLERSIIRTPRADGFDSDFSRGVVRDSLFEMTGNDAVDVSGTALSLENVTFVQIGDKAVSVGEESSLDAQALTIDGTSTGVASKDLSVALVRNSSFNNVSGSALITYIKKSEYGSAAIECQDCTFSNFSFLATNQNGSQIVIDGVAMPVTNFNQQQLVEAGFATEQ